MDLMEDLRGPPEEAIQWAVDGVPGKVRDIRRATREIVPIDCRVLRISAAQTLRPVGADAGSILQRAHSPNQVGQTRQRC